jgi:hypothetical protein
MNPEGKFTQLVIRYFGVILVLQTPLLLVTARGNPQYVAQGHLQKENE